MRISRIVSLVLAALLVLTLPAAAEESSWLIPPVKDAPAFTDTADSWCQDEVSVLYEAGLMEGISDTYFGVSNTLMPEHVVTVCARLYSLLTGGDGTLPAPAEGEPWYQPAYDSLAESLDYPGGSEALMMNFHATKYPARRWHFIDILSQTLEAAGVELPAINQVTVVPDSADPEVLAFYNAGILAGTDAYGTFDGNDTLTRGQAAAILARLVDPALRQTFSLKSFDLCADVLDLPADSQGISVEYGETAAELSLDIVAPKICENLREQYNHMVADGASANRLEQVLPDTLDAFRKDVAIAVLAQEKGITVTAEEVSEGYSGPFVSGYLGMSEAAQTWANTHNLLHSKLLEYYNREFGAEAAASSPGAPTVGEEHLEADLQTLKDQMTVHVAPELEQLDLAAVQMRYVQSPVYSA